MAATGKWRLANRAGRFYVPGEAMHLLWVCDLSLPSLTGSTKVVSRGGEGTFLNLYGHLRIPTDVTLWEFYSHLKVWDKIDLRLDYTPWYWGGPGHVSGEGNFAGLLLKKDDAIQSELSITSFIIGADYDVSFSRDLIFGPNADLHLMKWVQRVSKDGAAGVDFSQTMIQPAIGAHVRYQPTNTGYFSWFKPYLEGRFSWMSLAGLGLSTWDAGAGHSSASQQECRCRYQGRL